MKNKAFTLIELLVVVAIIGILAAVGVTTFNGFQQKAKVSAVKANFKNVVKFINTDAMNCVISGGTVFRQSNKSGGGLDRNCSDTSNNGPFSDGELQTHIGYSGIAKNPYGNVGEDRTCDIWSGWTAMTSVQSAALGKKMCKGQIGIYTLSKNSNNCHREIVIQAGTKDAYWTFSSKASSGVLSETLCIEHY
tara:strand:- start:15 stop:590 length:576 start_codon:yes stop_codon:yes gene_type:complete